MLGFCRTSTLGVPMLAQDALDHYLLFHDLRGSSADYYRRVVSAYRTQCGDEIDSRKLSEWLGRLKDAGRSDYYRRSVRNGLGALLRFCGDKGPIRPIRLSPLENDCWTVEDVRKLIAACNGDAWWQAFIEAAWSTGLSGCDLLRLTRDNVRGDGVVVTRRSKTGKPVCCWIRPELLATRPAKGELWPWEKSAEWMRRQFAEIVRRAGLRGTLKKLRRSAAASVEVLHPQQAHQFLANTRRVCEAHYLPASLFVRAPLTPASLT